MPQDTQEKFSLPLSRPMWYISRGQGVNVPLVAVDELPIGVDICGVPRQLDDPEAEHMECLGQVPPTGTFYVLKTNREHPGDATTGTGLKPLVPANGQAGGVHVHRATSAADGSPKPISHSMPATQQTSNKSVMPDSSEQNLKVFRGLIG